MKLIVAALLLINPVFSTGTQSRPVDDHGKIVIDSLTAIVSAYNEALFKTRDPERAARSAHYDEHSPGTAQIWEDSPPQLLALASDVTTRALPINSSDAILIGTITEGSSYLSSDQRNIYSEFKFRMQELLKTPRTLSLTTGQIITIEHPGGAIQLPSGKIIVRGQANLPAPSVGSRYVLFLKYLDSTRDFSIQTGYLLDGQTVRYLNDCFTGELSPSLSDPSGKTPPAIIHPAGSQYAGDESRLLKQIRDALITFSRLRLWIDENHDGVCQAHELHTLPELGVFSLALKYIESRRTDDFGNLFRYRAKVNPDPNEGESEVGRWAFDVFLATTDK
jgi:hypothetical protein